MSARALVLVALFGIQLLVSAHAQPAPQGEGAARFPRYDGLLTVQSALNLGLEQSLTVAMNRAQLRQIEADLLEAQSASRPQISVSGFAMKNSMPMIYQSAPGVMPTFLQQYPEPGALSANAMLMFPLFTGGALENRLQAAEQAQKGAVARLAFGLRESARQIRNAYYQVQLARANRATLGWRLAQTKEVERVAREQLEVGRAARYVLLRAQAEVANTEQEINDAEAELVRLEAELKQAMSIAVDSEFDYPEEEPTPAGPAALSDLLATALSDRGDLVAARYAVEQSDRQVAAAVSEYAPKAYLVGMGEVTRVAPFTMPMTESGYSVGLVLSFPVFDGGMREAGEERARATLEERRLRLRQMELEVSAQVVSTRAQLVAALDNYRLSQVELDKATEDWRIARLRLQAGRAIYVEVLDSLTALARARNNRVRALSTAHIAEADLLYATGRY